MTFPGRLAGAAIRHRALTLLISLVLLGLAAVGAARLQIDFSSTSFYGDKDARHQLEQFRARWGPDDAHVVLVVQASEGGTLLTGEHLHALDRLGARLRDLEDVRSTLALTDLGIRPALLEHAFVREGLLSHPQLVPLFLSADGRYAAVLVEHMQSSDDLPTTVEVMQRLEHAIGARPLDGLEVHVAGVPAIRAAFFALTLHDQARLVPATLVIMSVLLLVTFRRVHGVVAPMLAALFPVVLLLGLMGFVGEPIGLVNQAYFTLLPVVAVADSVHLVSRALEELETSGARDPQARVDAIVRAASRVGRACLVTSTTTAIGFASLTVSDMPVLRNFGLFAAVGIAMAYFVVLTLVPVVLTLGGDALVIARRPGLSHALATRSGAMATRAPVPVLLVALGLAVAAGVLAPRVKVENRLTGLVEAAHPAAQASALVDEMLGGTLSVELELHGPPGWFADAEGLRALEALTAWARNQPRVRAVIGPGMGGPVARAPKFIREGGSRVRLSIRVQDLGGSDFVAFEDRVREQLQIRGLQGVLTGTTSMAYRGLDRITRELRRSLMLVFVVVTLAIGILLRSVRTALISIMPNLLPLLLAYGAVAAIGLPLDPLGMVVLVIALGLAVDDTIHLTVRYQEYRSLGHTATRAAALAVESSGRAVAVTSVILAAGLSINLLSSFPPLRVLGGLGASVITLALVADLLVLPALWSVMDRSRSRGPEPDSPRGSEPPAAGPG